MKKLKYNCLDQCLFIIQMDIEDTFWNIVKYIPMKYILQLQLLSKQHQEWIHNMPYFIRNKTIRLSKIPQIAKIMVTKYQLTNIDLFQSFIHDEDLDFKCTTVNLYACSQLTHKFTKKISSCRSLFLSYKCNMLSLQYLTNIQDLYVADCIEINDECVKYLSHCRRLDISKTMVTEKSLPYLINCYGLAIACMQLTNFKILGDLKCQLIDLSYTNIDDTSIQYLVNRKVINLYQTRVTKNGIHLLNNCQAINVSDNIYRSPNQINVFCTRYSRYNFKNNDSNRFRILFLKLMYDVDPNFYLC